MTAEAAEQLPVPTVLPTIQKSAESTKSKRPLNEKIVYRKTGLPTLSESVDIQKNGDHAECPRCHSVITVKLVNKNEEPRAASSVKSRCQHSALSLMTQSEAKFESRNSETPRQQTPKKYLKKGKLYRSVSHVPDKDNVDWSDLNVKIDDWFQGAKTPDQKVVFNFLNEIKQEEDDETSTVVTEVIPPKVKSLEGILDNLKKYRNKFQVENDTNPALPKLKRSELPQLYESSTWRVMRHIRSADIRNKYPLPKANPDCYFRNSTVFHVAGRVPKSTFLIHPEWV